MLLSVQPAAITPPALTFTFTVPGQQTWYPRSFRATSDRASGGPNRAYLLQITDGTNVVAAIGAEDAGDEPGSCIVTWCDTPNAAVHAGAQGVVVAPLPPLVLKPGYIITGTILNPAAGDSWTDVVVWFDFTYTNN